jgi:phage I-like protein
MSKPRVKPLRPQEIARGRVALCTELDAEGGAPEWVQLLPKGADVVGRDGRKWINDKPAAVVSAFKRDFSPLPIDWNHATEYIAKYGGEAPAAGWIEELDLREDGSLWGKVTWTERGERSVNAREYRFLSPVFKFDAETSRILQLFGCALTNSPNLRLTAINSREDEPEREESNMDEKLLATLGLPKTATVEQALNAIEALKEEKRAALNSAQTPSPEKFVPRADYDLAMNRARSAEDKLSEQSKAEHTKEVNAAVDAAIAAGKIAPASKQFYVDSCGDAAALERFKAFAAAAPAVIDPKSPLLGTQPPTANQGELTPNQMAICTRMGIAPEDFKKARA